MTEAKDDTPVASKRERPEDSTEADEPRTKQARVNHNADDAAPSSANESKNAAAASGTDEDKSEDASDLKSNDTKAESKSHDSPEEEAPATADRATVVAKAGAPTQAPAGAPAPTQHPYPLAGANQPPVSTTAPGGLHARTQNSYPPASGDSQIVEERGEVSSLYVGRVIGKGGEMIRDLQARSACRIDVDQNVPPGQPRVITYRGTRRTVDFAKQLVHLLCQENASDNDLPLGEAKREYLVVPAQSVGKIIGRGGEVSVDGASSLFSSNALLTF